MIFKYKKLDALLVILVNKTDHFNTIFINLPSAFSLFTVFIIQVDIYCVSPSLPFLIITSLITATMRGH